MNDQFLRSSEHVKINQHSWRSRQQKPLIVFFNMARLNLTESAKWTDNPGFAFLPFWEFNYWRSNNLAERFVRWLSFYTISTNSTPACPINRTQHDRFDKEMNPCPEGWLFELLPIHSPFHRRSIALCVGSGHSCLSVDFPGYGRSNLALATVGVFPLFSVFLSSSWALLTLMFSTVHYVRR